jgi:hypothetical protein
MGLKLIQYLLFLVNLNLIGMLEVLFMLLKIDMRNEIDGMNGSFYDIELVKEDKFRLFVIAYL